MSLKIIPAPGYVLIEPLEAERTTASGIVLPDSHEGEKPLRGKVVAVGPEGVGESGNKIPLWTKIKVGTIAIYKKWAGNEYKADGKKELLFVKFEEILAVEE